MTSRFFVPFCVASFLCGALAPFGSAARAQEPAPAQPPTTPATPPTPAPTSTPTATPKPTPAAKVTPEFAEEKLGVEIVLTDGLKTVKRTRKELGFRLTPQAHGGAVSFAIDKAALKDALERIAPDFKAEAVNARPYAYEGQTHIRPGASARSLNVPTTAETLIQKVTANPAERKFSVTLDKKPPVLTTERLNGVTGALSTFTTRTSADSNRNVNVGLAAGSIDGTLLSPGETFSLNQTVGERTEKAGYKSAHVFVDAKIVDGIGGGVSQVTGTLFNAAARAGLQIVEVHPHSRPVAYLPLGYDATVAWGDKDLKFKNNTKAPVYISYTFSDRNLTARIWGAKEPGVTHVLRASVRERGPGKINAQMYRLTKQNGTVVNKERLFSHAYRWDPNAKSAP